MGDEKQLTPEAITYFFDKEKRLAQQDITKSNNPVTNNFYCDIWKVQLQQNSETSSQNMNTEETEKSKSIVWKIIIGIITTIIGGVIVGIILNCIL